MDGYPKVMSSYHFSDSDAGPPGSGGCANSSFVYEHRWTAIANMVMFRNVTNGEGVANWWDNGNNRIAFSRGSKGFVAINNEDGAMGESLQTGMPAGRYCNVANGDFDGNRCTGSVVDVDDNGRASISVPGREAVAIHLAARLPVPGDGGDGGDGDGGDGSPVDIHSIVGLGLGPG